MLFVILGVIYWVIRCFGPAGACGIASAGA